MRYEPLRKYLASLSEPVVVLSYEDIEKLLGRRLPPTAYGEFWRQWWANTETHSQARAWLSAGWRVARPDRTHKTVEFRRSAVRPDASRLAPSERSAGEVKVPPEPVRGIVVPQDQLVPSALRMIEDAAEELAGDMAQAVARLLNEAAMARRRQLLDWFAENVPASGTRSVDLIRDDRNGR